MDKYGAAAYLSKYFLLRDTSAVIQAATAYYISIIVLFCYYLW